MIHQNDKNNKQDESVNGYATHEALAAPDWMLNAPISDDEYFEAHSSMFQEIDVSEYEEAYENMSGNDNSVVAISSNGSNQHESKTASKPIDTSRFVGSSISPSVPRLDSPVVEPVSLATSPNPADTKFIVECMRLGGDYGDALLLASIYQGKLCYDHKAKAWFLWSGHYWIEDERNVVNLLIPNHLAAQYLAASAHIQSKMSVEKDQNPFACLCPNADNLENALKDLVDSLYKHRKRLMFKSRRNDVLDQAKALMGITGNEWDQNGWLLGCKNGVLQLKSGEIGFRNGKPDDYIKTIADVEWTGLSKNDCQFDKFLSEILEGATNHGETLHYFQNFLGYSILGMAHENVFIILYGDKGQNGKGTLSRVLSKVLGSKLCGTVSEDVFVAKRRNNTGAASPHLVDLRGMRLAWCAETKEGARLSEDQVKRLTGGENLKARGLFQKPIEWEPTHTLFLMTNDKPHINADDDAIWKRTALVPFTISFVANPKRKFERLKNTQLVQEMTTETGKSEVLGSLVKWCLRYQNERLILPDSLQLEVDTYRKEEDTLGAFLEDCCVISEDAQRCYEDRRQSKTKVKADALYKAYKEWHEELSASKPMSNSAFGKKVKKRFYSKKTNKGRFYFGVGLKAQI